MTIDAGVSKVVGAANRPLPEGRASLQQAAQSFEAYLIQLLLKEMRDTIPGSGVEGSGLGGGMYQSITDEALATAMSKTGGIGLAKMLVGKVAAESRSDPQVLKGIDR
ncbi:MAG: rod-binding protein [Nitrospirae bacterium]|nr:rod-binding protein [Nitrospirota bacterium]